MSENENSGTTEENNSAEDTSSEDLVSIPEATDDELEGFLQDELMALEKEDDSEETPAYQTPPADQTKQPAKQEAAEADETPAPAAIDEKAEKERLMAYIKQKEAFIQKRNQEIGALRKQFAEQNEKLSENLDEKYIENPREAIKADQKIRDNEKILEDLDEEEQKSIQYHTRQKVVAQNLRPDEANMDDMINVLKGDGLPPEFIQAFRANPYEQAQAETIIQLGKRAHSEKLLKQLVGYTKKLLEENKTLKGKPNEIAKKIQSTLREPARVTAKGGTTATAKTPSIDAISSWTQEQIDAHLANH